MPEKKVYGKSLSSAAGYTDYSGNSRGYVSEAFFRETGVKQTDLTQGSLKISLKNPLYTEKDIIRMQNAVGLERMQIIEGDYDTISSFLRCPQCFWCFWR